MQVCDNTFWKKPIHPNKHQLHQTAHATFTCRNTDLDWLAQIDVAEFLRASSPTADLLQHFRQTSLQVHIRPIDAIADTRGLFKANFPNGPDREALVEILYPIYGGFVLVSFLSYTQSKLLVRTGIKNLNCSMRNLFRNKQLLLVKLEPT